MPGKCTKGKKKKGMLREDGRKKGGETQVNDDSVVD